MDEQSLEVRVVGGDADALPLLLEKYRTRIRAFVAKNMSVGLQQKVDPDDVIQDAFMSCINAFGEIDLSNRRPFDWVCHVANRRILDAGRRFFGAQKRDANREVRGAAGGEGNAGIVNLLVASITSPSKAFSRQYREFNLWSAFEELPEEHRRALQMRYVESLPTKEIAERLGKSDGAIRVMLTRSLKKLEQLYVARAQP